MVHILYHHNQAQPRLVPNRTTHLLVVFLGEPRIARLQGLRPACKTPSTLVAQKLSALGWAATESSSEFTHINDVPSAPHTTSGNSIANMGRGPKKHQKRLSAPSHWLLDKLSGSYAPKASPGRSSYCKGHLDGIADPLKQVPTRLATACPSSSSSVTGMYGVNQGMENRNH